ncbi:MAG TPA: type II toxin-antitoxin system RelE/ParE family toxin [Pseudolabrys sp.]|jgi:plasmid stabilization system protein ParE|nr:type II toxin-antitoxin system RelE/ParE family toxin [Pseudolabrys sp.]
MNVRFSRLALAELEDILSDLAQKDIGAAERFHARIQQITERLGQFPNSFQEVAERPGIRRVPLLRYPYLVFYRIFDEEVIVLRVVHGARKEPWEYL